MKTQPPARHRRTTGHQRTARRGPTAWPRQTFAGLVLVALLFALGGPGQWVHLATGHTSHAAHTSLAKADASAVCLPAEHRAPASHDPAKSEQDNHPASNDCRVCDLLLTTHAAPGPVVIETPAPEAHPPAPRTVALLAGFEPRSAAQPRGPPAGPLPGPPSA